ncbi:WD40 repeat-like protein [Rhizopogon salebrosus TDB-379]|nr:WD40 repeat-like protein [Rhizopogon salebrosus TDB-379]
MDMASISTQSTGTRKMIVGMTLVGHGRLFYYTPDGKRRERSPTIAYFPDGQKMLSGADDKTTRLWDLHAGTEIEEARVVGEQEVDMVAVSSDGRWVVTAGILGVHKVKANEVKTGSVETFEGHTLGITCIDISMDSKLLASGSWNGMVARIWSLDTGELVAGPFDSVGIPGTVDAVRFSHDSRKLAMKSESYLEVWDIQAQKLDNRVRKPSSFPGSWPHVPVFWTTKDRTIVAAFCFTEGDNGGSKTIYEFDSSTLETVGTPFEGHTHPVSGLALSNDSTLLASTSYDSTIKLWAFESRHLLASFVGTAANQLVLSPDSRKLAYTNYGSHKIYIYDISPDILASIWPTQEAPTTSAPASSPIGDSLNSNATRRPTTVRRNQVSPSFALLPPRPSPITYPHQSTFIGHLRKLLPFSFGIDSVPRVQVDEPRDPLDFPATLRLPPNDSTHAATQVSLNEIARSLK